MFEVVYWLDRYKCEGRCAVVLYPLRSDKKDVIFESVVWIKEFCRLIDKIERSTLDKIVENGIPGGI